MIWESFLLAGEIPNVLTEFLSPPAWQKDALCREPAYAGVDFFVERGENGKAAAARAVCERCSVRAECLQAALDGHEHGVWGGTTERERKTLRRTHRAA